MKTVHWLFLILIIPFMIWGGFAVQLLWGWFVAPLGLPTISLLHAMGINVFVNYFIMQVDIERKEFNWPKLIGGAIGRPAGAILVGLIIQTLM